MITSYILASILRKFDHADLLLREFGENTSLISEMSAYLREPTIEYQTECHAYERIQYLQKFPLIKQLYLKYNCISPTEADVERVFSYAGRFSLIQIVPSHTFLFSFHFYFGLWAVCNGFWVVCVLLSSLENEFLFSMHSNKFFVML